MYSRSKYLLPNHTTNIHLIQLQPQEVENIGKAYWLFASWQISGTRWSDRVVNVKPFIADLPGVNLVFEYLLELYLTPRTRNEIHGAVCYISSFTCIIMSVVWHRILVPIDACNLVIQASDAISDMELHT